MYGTYKIWTIHSTMQWKKSEVSRRLFKRTAFITSWNYTYTRYVAVDEIRNTVDRSANLAATRPAGLAYNQCKHVNIR